MSLFAKFAYVTLTILLIAQPHIIKGHVFSIPQPFAQSLATVLIGVAALAIYLLHLRDVESTNRAKHKVEQALATYSVHLNEAYRYVGQVNQRLPLLQSLTTELISLSRQGKKATKKIFEDLLATAVVTLAKTRWGFFRFIEAKSAKTLNEYYHVTGNSLLFRTRIGNKEILEMAEQAGGYHIRDDAYVIATSDQSAPIKCVFVFAKPEHVLAPESDLVLVQALVDQAQLFYKYLH